MNGEEGKTEKRKPAMPPVSKAGGGLVPGMDLWSPGIAASSSH
jgi:hypothetical protein